ncbi:MAG: DUF4864 domain-containing protein [Rhodospirillaceae bacterium]|nr:DUF4864 domain-containing protein [Rhodospirillaceae bacterium]
MGRVVACLALIAAVAAWPGTPAAGDAADQAAIIAVIRAQLDAFRRDAAAEAFAYASPSIQRAFRTPDAFMAMVRGGYRPAYRPRSVDFLDLVTTSGGLTQRVLFVGPDGAPVVAHYHMQRQPDGSWRIDGVTLYDSSQPV